ncbi:MAG: 5'-nucleotidase C-terminal domain-containing protein [Propionibacteriaceae bacterium]|nr:5'-nucleotidase C-terminal domain-containing protein [Propionibacteriaceae bacterium]
MDVRKRTGTAIAVLGLVATAGLAGPAQAAEKTEAISDGLTQINLMTFNDFHGRIDGGNLDGQLGRQFACSIVTQRAALGDESTLLLSAGDNIGASIFASSIAQDTPTLEYLNALGLDASAVGNHEFDAGFADLDGRVTEAADFPLLGANVYERGTTTPALQEYSIHEVNGLKVGVIGVVTDETPSLVSPTGVASIDFGDQVEAVNRVAAQLSDGNADNGEADVIVAAYHDGAAVASSLADAQEATEAFNAIATQTSEQVDVILNGHTHQAYTWDAPAADGTRSLTQAGSYGGNLAVVKLGIDPETKDVTEYASSLVGTGDVTPDCEADATYQAADAIVTDAIAKAKELGSVKVTEISADITTAFKDAQATDGFYTGTQRDDRLRESSLGNLIANAWLWAMNVPGRSGADIGIQNPGGIRAELLHKASGTEGDGVVTFAEAAAVNPFANTLQTIEVSGEQFKAVLEQQWQPEGSSRPFLKLGLSDNVRYTYDPARPAGDRITSITYNGKRMDPAATFRVAAGSFLIGGGDNFTALQGGKNVTDSGQIDTDAFVNYLKKDATPVAPTFGKNGVAVTGPTFIERGKDITLTVEGVDLTSLGAPVNTQWVVVVDDFEIGTATITPDFIEGVPTRHGKATVTMNVSPFYIADNVQLVAKPSGTVVTLELAQLRKKTFKDVSADIEHAKEMTWIGSTGIATGWEDGTYRPVTAINRDAMAAFLYRLAGSPEFTPPATPTFSDVPADNLYYKEIEWLASTKITTGWGDGTFQPLAPINRDAMAAFLYRLAGSPEYNAPASSPFTDLKPADMFFKEITWLSSTKITTGWPDGTYRPVDAVNRDAMAAFLYRFVDNLGVPKV